MRGTSGMALIFVKTFKGYEDKTLDLDADVNAWILRQGNAIQVVGLQTALSHENGGRAGSGDLIYTLLYKADAPVP